MKYKLFKVTFNNSTQEFDIPTGWNMESVIYADDATVIVKLVQYEQNTAAQVTISEPVSPSWSSTITTSPSWDVNSLVFNPGRGTSY